MAHRQFLTLTLLAATVACGGGTTSPVTPSPAPAPSGAAKFALFGAVREWPTIRPIAGATVSVVDGPNAGIAAITNASGDYRLGGLQPGQFTIAVSALDHAPQTIVVTLISDLRRDFQLLHQGIAYQIGGTVTDEDGGPVAGASVTFDFVSPDNASRYGQLEVKTDAAGLYRISFTAVPAGYAGSVAFARATRAGHEGDHRWFPGGISEAPQTLNFHLYRVRRITAGDATTVTIAPDDAICFNNLRDSPGIGPDYVCRTVRVVAPTDGVMTIEAISIANGRHPSVAVETVNRSPYVLRLENPTAIPVVTGTEVMVNIELAASSSSRESFMLTTAMAAQP